jgi:hypothetical protein
MCSKYSQHLAKKSEYNNNYKPFDYYDFCITAKENENLRFRNKIRDYIHTPFEWDDEEEEEAQDFNKQLINQITQTSAYNRRNEALNDDHRGCHYQYRPHHKYNNYYRDLNQNLYQTDYQYQKRDHQEQRKTNETASQCDNKQTKQQNDSEQQQSDSTSTEEEGEEEVPYKAHIDPKSNKNLKEEEDDTPIVLKEPTIKQDHKHCNCNQLKQTPSYLKKQQKEQKCQKKRSQSALPKKVTNNPYNDNLNKSIENRLIKSISNMSVQTPHDWKLREYQKNQKSLKNYHSASLTNLQPKRPPFANYGSGIKSKDMSKKPTHNALANKSLAYRHGDKDAIIELQLTRLKRKANLAANQMNAVEVLPNELRSDSRLWSSEYAERYPDYTTINNLKYKSDMFPIKPKQNFRLQKSTFIK